MKSLEKYHSSLIVYKENLISSLQSEFLNHGNTEIRLPAYFPSEEFIQLNESTIGIGDKKIFTLVDMNGTIINCCAMINDYETLASSSQNILCYDKTKSRLVLFNKEMVSETDFLDFERPSETSLRAYLLKDLIIVTSGRYDQFTQISIFDYHFKTLNTITVYSFNMLNIYCVSQDLFIAILNGKSGESKLYYINNIGEVIVHRHVLNSYVSSLYGTEGNLALNQNWIHWVDIYDWKKDDLYPLLFPQKLKISQFSRIKFRNNGKSGFNYISSDSLLERYDIVQKTSGHYRLELSSQIEGVTYFDDSTKSDRFILYHDQKDKIIKDASTMETILKISKDSNPITYLENDSLIIRSSVKNNINLRLLDFKTHKDHNITLPVRHNIRTVYPYENRIYFGMEDDDRGIGMFSFMTGEYKSNPDFSRIRQFVHSGRNSFLAAGWYELFELDENLKPIRQFPLPVNIDRGYQVEIYKDLVIYSGYAKEKGQDNFIIVYSYDNLNVEFMFIDKNGSNAYSYPVKITDEGIMYYTALTEEEKWIIGYDLNKMQPIDFKVKMMFDFREVMIHENYLYAVNLHVGSDGINYIDVIDLDNSRRHPAFAIRNPKEILDISLINNKIIFSFNNGSYWVYNNSGCELIFDFEINTSATWFDCPLLPGFGDVIMLNCHQKVLFYDLKKREILGEMSIFGNDIIISTEGEKWVYSTNRNIFSFVREDKNGLKEYLGVENTDRKRYLNTYHSLQKVIEHFNPKYYFEKMKTEFLQNLKTEKTRPKMLK